jgi:predicted nucleotidyltransferase
MSLKLETFRPLPEERDKVLAAMRQALEARPEVVFAYVHGSFVEDRPVHDVDVAVYLAPGAGDGATLTALSLAAELERALPPTARLPVDVRLLNQAPTGFRYHAFRGRLLFSRDEEARSAMVERTVVSYLDRKPILEQALKEAMRA